MLLRNNLTVKSTLATVLGEGMRNALQVWLSKQEQAKLTHIQKAAISVAVDAMLEHEELLVFGPSASLIVVLPRLKEWMSSEAAEVHIAEALDEVVEEIGSKSVQLGLETGSRIGWTKR